MAVVEKPTSISGTLRFECNRSLTGTGHEYYRKQAGDVEGDRPCDLVARRLFEVGAAVAVHINSNQITVTLANGHDGHGVLQDIEELFIYYLPGVEPSIP